MSRASYSTIVCACGMRIGSNGAARASHRRGLIHARRMETVRAAQVAADMKTLRRARVSLKPVSGAKP